MLYETIKSMYVSRPDKKYNKTKTNTFPLFIKMQ